MKFEEYLDTLPKNVLSGEDVQLPEKTFRDIFKFVALGKDDIFYHLGCHDEKGIEIANAIIPILLEIEKIIVKKGR